MVFLSKFRREQKQAKQQAKIEGKGKYLYQNITHADLLLPRPTKDGRTRVGPREQFVADSYYKVVKDLICLQEIEAPMQEEKLILEIPPMVTPRGTIEFVEEKKPAAKPLQEHQPAEAEEPMLLNEAPLDGVRIVF